MVAVSLPQLNTESQFDNAVQDITEPIPRVRTRKIRDNAQQKKVSMIVFL